MNQVRAEVAVYSVCPTSWFNTGKSTTLKNFQLMNSSKVRFSPPLSPSVRKSHSFQAFNQERPSWRAVVQYNVARSMRLIMEAITEAQASGSTTPTSTTSRRTRTDSSSSSGAREKLDYPPLTSEHLKLKMRLSPLVQVEEELVRKITLGGSYDSQGRGTPNFVGRAKEIAVNSTVQWKGVFGRLVNDARDSIDSDHLMDWDDPNDPGIVLHACAADMKALWHDPTIQKLLRIQKLRLEEVAGL